jgi:hypothetical protein
MKRYCLLLLLPAILSAESLIYLGDGKIIAADQLIIQGNIIVYSENNDNTGRARHIQEIDSIIVVNNNYPIYAPQIVFDKIRNKTGQKDLIHIATQNEERNQALEQNVPSSKVNEYILLSEKELEAKQTIAQEKTALGVMVLAGLNVAVIALSLILLL